MQAVYKKLKGITGWKTMDPKGLNGGLLIGLSDKIVIKQVESNDFCFEVEFEEIG